MAIENQGYIANSNLKETTNESLALANLAGVTIPDDLRIIQNNLRNISTIGYSSFFDGFFQFSDLEFIFTNDDKIKVSKNVSIGSQHYTKIIIILYAIRMGKINLKYLLQAHL